MPSGKARKYTLKFLRILARGMAGILLFLLILVIAIQFPVIQTYLAGRVAAWLSEQTGAVVEVEQVAIRFPSSIEINGLHIEEPGGDTLVHAGRIYTDIRMVALFRGRVHIDLLQAEDLTAFIYREPPDSVFNFQFLADAFGGNGDEQPDPEENGLDIHLGVLSLNNIRVSFNDHFTGTRLFAGLEEFSTDLGDSDLMNGRYHVGVTLLRDSNIEFYSYEPAFPQVEPDDEPAGIDVSLTSLEIRNSRFVSGDDQGNLLTMETALLDLLPRTIDLEEQYINISSLRTDSMRVFMRGPPRENEVRDDSAVGHPTGDEPEGFNFAQIMEWRVGLGLLEVRNSSVGIMTEEASISGNTFDAGNFTLDNFELRARNINVAPESIELYIDTMAMRVSDQFILEHLELSAIMGRNGSGLSFRMESAESSAGLTMQTDANLLNFVTAGLYGEGMFLEVTNTHINEDIAFFVPDLRQYWFDWPEAGGITAGIRIDGTPAHMVIDSLRLDGGNLFSASVRGEIAGLPDMDNLFLDLEEFGVFAVPPVFIRNIPELDSPEGFTIPETVTAEGRFRGTPAQFEAALNVEGSGIGEADLVLAMKGETGNEVFEGRVRSGSFDIGRLMQLEELQRPLAFDLDFTGRGLDPETMELNALMIIGNLHFMGHSYEDITLDIAVRDSSAFVSTTYSDQALSLDLDAAAGIFMDQVTASGRFLLEYADLQQLGLSEEELRVGTGVKADIILEPPGFFRGNVTISATSISMEDDVYKIPEISVVSESRTGEYSFSLSSELMSARYTGNISPLMVADVLAGHSAEYFDMPGLSEPDDTLAGENFAMDLHLFPSDAVTTYLPDLHWYDTLSLFLDFESRTGNLSFTALIDSIRYGDMYIWSLQAGASSDPEIMDFHVLADSLRLNNTFFRNARLDGDLFSDTISLIASVSDESELELVRLGAMAAIHEGLYYISLLPGELILNYDRWEVHPGNLVVAGEEHLAFSNFTLEHKGSMISVANPDPGEWDDVTVLSLREFDLRSISDVADPLMPLGGGILDGDVTLRNLFGEMSFTADLAIDSLVWDNYAIDSIRLLAQDAGPGQLYLEATVEDAGTSVSISGTYSTGQSSSVDIRVNVDRFDMQLVELFLPEEITHLSGNISANLHAEGTLPEPRLNGAVNFSGIAFRVPLLNAGYFITDEQIVFDDHVVRLDDFVLEDSLGRTATIDGNVDISDFDNINLHLDFSTRNFMLMNLPERRGEMYFGRILMDSDLEIRGTHHGPSIGGRLRLNPGSQFTFVIPQTAPEAIGGEGVVEFISPGEEEFFRRVIAPAEPEELRAPVDIMTIALNIELDPATILRVVIDEVAGDFLELQGGAALTFGIDPGGLISLAGRYEIDDGEYMLSFHDVARRRFEIVEGSNIVFTGDPMEAEVDITTRYTLSTGVTELMRPIGRGDQPRGEEIRTTYPFWVYLNMEGELMAPDISFRLDMPPEHRGAMNGAIMSRINAINNDDSELNKQVFALLILGNFIHESPFAEGPGISATARSSASQILSQQLNRLSDRYVRGVNISFELESYEVDRGDEDPVGRTELQVEISRDFFNDRLRVAVGGQIELEDETHRETRPGDIAGDFSLEYLIRPEGDLLLRGFRQREFGDLVDGEITKTGISLVFSRSYDNFRQLFRRQEEQVVPMVEPSQ